VEWPGTTHEVPLTDLKEAISPAMQQLPIDRHLLRVTLESNFTFKSSQTGFSATPDLSLVLMPLIRRGQGHKDFQVLALVECAFSQDEVALKEKLRKELATRPETVLVIMILINEHQDYRSPKEGSAAWNLFSQEEECRDIDSFFCLEQSDTNSIQSSSNLGEERFQLKPVVIAGHEWCHMMSVEYRVWVKDDATDIINIDKDKMTCGVGDVFHHWQLPLTHFLHLDPISKGFNELCGIDDQQRTIESEKLNHRIHQETLPGS